MKTRTLVLALMVSVAGATASFAANANMGKWKLNEAKSKFSPGAPHNTVVVYEAAGDSVKVTVDGVDEGGKATHNEWTGKFDGKEYPVMGSPTGDTRAYTEVDDHTLMFTEKKGGRVTTSGRITVAADGKSRTVTSTATNAQGMTVDSTAVFDKQ